MGSIPGRGGSAVAALEQSAGGLSCLPPLGRSGGGLEPTPLLGESGGEGSIQRPLRL